MLLAPLIFKHTCIILNVNEVEYYVALPDFSYFWNLNSRLKNVNKANVLHVSFLYNYYGYLRSMYIKRWCCNCFCILLIWV